MASFVWPAGGNFSTISPTGLINVYDVLEFTYASPWSALNVTVFCQSNTNSGSSSYRVSQAPGNPLIANGGYRIGTINDFIGKIDSYPVWCSVKLTRYGNNDDAQGGDNFRVISSANLQPATYRPTSTSSTDSASSQSTAAASSQLTTTTTSQSNTNTATTTTSQSTANTATSIPSTSSQSQTSPTSGSSSQISSTNTGLSTGAKAGIAVGGVALVALIAFLCFLLFRSRKRERMLAGASYGYKGVQNGAAAQYHQPVQELPYNDIKELPIQEIRPVELQGTMLPPKHR